ncbi:MAG: ATP-binding cassette domain-containing protein [Deltaproteobacteria bacterium]|nr:ATP-binding cassette domain-containing protein [Deltaproteobacteria bacterium]
MISVRSLTKYYGSTPGVQDINFSVRRGEIFGFLGPNGAGKSTTMRILTCYHPADSGTATIAGFDVFENPLEVRRLIGYLPENNPLYMDMGIVDYLEFIAKVRAIPPSTRKEKIKHVIELCGLRGELGKNIGELSKGFRQRVGLAQALIHDPDILILDEPTIGLDPTQIIEIRELIKQIGKEKTIILSSHILPEVSATCDRIIIIHQGEIVGSGTPDEMASKAKGGEIIYITIRGPLPEVQAKLETMEKIKEFKKISEKEGKLNQFEIKSDIGVDLTEELFFLVSQNGWSLTELHKETADLENIFLQLTTGEG